jgi:hypothetical protein
MAWFLVTHYAFCYFQFPKSWLHPSLWPSYARWSSFHFSKGLSVRFACVRAALLAVCLFHRHSFCHVHKECYRQNVLTVADFLLVWFLQVSCKSMFCFEDRPDVMIPSTLELFGNALHVGNKHRTKRRFSLSGFLLSLEYWIESVNCGGLPLSWRLHLKLSILFNRPCCSWHMVEALLCRLWIIPLVTCGGWLDSKLAAIVGGFAVYLSDKC